MSNAMRNSLLVIVAVVCAVASVLVNRAFAQELLFPINNQVSFHAPNLDDVFGDHPYEFVAVSEQTVINTVAVVTETEKLTVVEEVTVVEDTTVAQSELLFPVSKKVSFQGPSLDDVFGDHPYEFVAVSEQTVINTVAVVTETEKLETAETVVVEDTTVAQSALLFPVKKNSWVWHQT